MKIGVMDTTTPTPQPQHLSSNTHFHRPNNNNNKVVNEDSQPQFPTIIEKENTSTKQEDHKTNNNIINNLVPRKKLQAVAISKVRSVLTVFSKNRSSNSSNIPFGLGSRVVGTLFGYRRGHVHIAFQKDPTSQPAFLIELATPITGLVREMASGLVRIALECDKQKKEEATEKKGTTSVMRLLQEPLWRTYCNGKKCGFASRRECGAKEWDILKAVEPISMGAGVLPAGNNDKDKDSDGGGEVMYMRARFERIVGSRDSEAFYMMNPDSNGAPELSIYLLRV